MGIKGKDILLIGTVGVLGYSLLNALDLFADDASVPPGKTDAKDKCDWKCMLGIINYEQNPLTTKNPANLISAAQQYICPPGEMYQPNIHQCVNMPGRGTNPVWWQAAAENAFTVAFGPIAWVGNWLIR